jgi:hypothetical protein
MTKVKHFVKDRYSKYPFLFNFLLISVMNLWLALHDRVSTYFNGVNALSTSAEATKVWGWSDSGSYLQMGLSQAKFGDLTSELLWTASFWPPGMSYLYAYSIRIAGLNGPFILVLIFFAAFLWASVLALLLKVFQEFMKPWIAVVMVVAIIQTDLYHEYLVRDAVIWSDGHASGFLCLSIILLYLGTKSSNYAYYLAAGASIASLIYLRGQYFPLLKILGALSLFLISLWIAGTLVSFSRLVYRFKFNRRIPAKRLLLPLLLITITSIAACAPYLLWREDNLGDISWDLSGKWHWTNVEPFAYTSNWLIQDDIPGFIREGGAGTACKIDIGRCSEVNNIEKNTDSPFNIYDQGPYSSRDFYEMTKSTFVSHPIKWFTIKIPYFYRYWISDPAISTPTNSNYLFAIVSAVGLGLLSFSLCLKTLRQHFLIPSLLSFIYMGLTLVPPYIAHLEVRYLVPAKLLGIVVFAGASGALGNRIVAKLIMMFDSRYS